jgi:hypothetical protein
MLRQIAHLRKEGQLAGAVFMAVAQKAVALALQVAQVQLAVRMAAAVAVGVAHLTPYRRHHLAAQAQAA